MRPVDRGPAPGALSRYEDAKRALRQRIGLYCAYCEARVFPAQVEHVLPKSEFPEFETDWDNLLFACAHCNPTKGVWPTRKGGGRDVALWPDQDNTWLSLDYAPTRPPRALPVLHPELEERIMALVERTGVDRDPLHPRYSPNDPRWEMRTEVWKQAEECRSELLSEDTETHRRRIVQLAAAKGFWSVWMTVFRRDPDLTARLREAFPGTAASCFDADGAPTPRPGGRI